MKALVKDLFKGSLTVPNLLTFLRIVMVPIFAVLFYKGEYGWAVFVLFLSGLSDFLDGKIARRFNQISALGKVLDPVADKLTQITIAILLFFTFRASTDNTIKAFSWVFLIFLVKEAIMVVGGAIMILCGLRPSAAELPGKLATFAFYAVMLIIVAFGPDIGFFNSVFTMPNWLTMTLVIISAALTLYAFWCYAPATVRQFKEKKNSKEQISKE